jgi:hypothetical protein
LKLCGFFVFRTLHHSFLTLFQSASPSDHSPLGSLIRTTHVIRRTTHVVRVRLALPADHGEHRHRRRSSSDGSR